MRVNFKLERSKLIRKKNASLNVYKIKQRKDEFQVQLRNRFQVLQDEVNQEDVNDIYNRFSHTVQTCALEIAGQRENQTTDKITKETLDLMGKRGQMKVSTQKDSIEYTESCKTIRKRMKSEIRSFEIKKVQETITNNSSYKATKHPIEVPPGDENGFIYEYETFTAMVPEVNIAIDRIVLTDPVDKQIRISVNTTTISARIRIGSFVDTGYVVGDRNWRLTFFAANSTNYRLSDEFPVKLSKKQQAMGLNTASTLTFNNVRCDLILGSLNCSTFTRICAKVYDSHEAYWVKGERSMDIGCTDINCHYGNKAVSSLEAISYILLLISIQTVWIGHYDVIERLYYHVLIFNEMV
ncbi:uncharacterized protein LOC121425328 [Lytechinus variegatus]|uniref:uncharacterized protein LOC121425328 n=1 Tax=Lytechinus variegatus TaxID=7654 RepID=UPI001BB28A83|nr:uncharacterized protein LOC121425328 [Lytechinus variegatus]